MAGTQSAPGSRFVEAMMTVVTTLNQQHRHVLAYMPEACQAAYKGLPALSLLPHHTEAEEDRPVAA
jgi:transposase